MKWFGMHFDPENLTGSIVVEVMDRNATHKFLYIP